MPLPKEINAALHSNTDGMHLQLGKLKSLLRLIFPYAAPAQLSEFDKELLVFAIDVKHQNAMLRRVITKVSKSLAPTVSVFTTMCEVSNEKFDMKALTASESHEGVDIGKANCNPQGSLDNDRNALNVQVQKVQDWMPVFLMFGKYLDANLQSCHWAVMETIIQVSTTEVNKMMRASGLVQVWRRSLLTCYVGVELGMA